MDTELNSSFSIAFSSFAAKHLFLKESTPDRNASLKYAKYQFNKYFFCVFFRFYFSKTAFYRKNRQKLQVYIALCHLMGI